jgi:hypothetical protein
MSGEIQIGSNSASDKTMKQLMLFVCSSNKFSVAFPHDLVSTALCYWSANTKSLVVASSKKLHERPNTHPLKAEFSSSLSFVPNLSLLSMQLL